MDSLAILHEVEWHIGGALADESLRSGVIDYLNDDPADTDPVYLIELFGITQADVKQDAIVADHNIVDLVN